MRARVFLTSAVLAGFVAISFGQPPPPEGPGFGPGRERIRERIRTVKIWKLAEELNLSEEQSQKFFPIYNSFQAERESLDEKRRDTMRRLDELTSKENPSEEDIFKLLNKLDDLGNEEQQKRLEFRQKIKGVLTPRQMGRLVVFELRFQQQMQEIMRDVRMEMRRGMRENETR